MALAPARFSTSTCWPSAPVSLLPNARASVSTGPPAAKGTMRWMDLSGQFPTAWTAPGAATTERTTLTTSRLSVRTSDDSRASQSRDSGRFIAQFPQDLVAVLAQQRRRIHRLQRRVGEAHGARQLRHLCAARMRHAGQHAAVLHLRVFEDLWHRVDGTARHPRPVEGANQ